MWARPMTLSQRQSILETAVQAPSGDNSQPWIFAWSEDVLTITHDAMRSQHPLNPGQSASALMLGCLLETIEIAALDVGFEISVKLLNLASEGKSPWAEVRFSSTTQAPDPLSQYIRIRSTDRREYKKGHLSPELFQDIKANEQKYFPAQMHFVSKVETDLQDYIIDAEQNLIDHTDILPEVMKWTRFTMSKARKTGDGISWRNMLAKVWELPVMYLMLKFPKLLNAVRPEMVRQHRARTMKQLNSAAGLVCVSTKKTAIPLEGAVQAGRLMMRVWLRLTQLGFGVQPISLATLPILFHHENVMDSFFSQKLNFFKKGEQLLKKTFHVPPENFPTWMIRTGISTPLPKELRTFRRPVEQ